MQPILNLDRTLLRSVNLAGTSKRELADFDALRRNVPDLPAFITVSYAKHVDLPVELKNEPYAFYDTGERMEIIVQRPKFTFSIHDHILTCGTGREVRIAQMTSRKTPTKNSTNISIVTVYDTYGLNVAYTYLDYLYHYKYNALEQKWLGLYLLTSLAILHPDALKEAVDVTARGMLCLCARLMGELLNLEHKQPKMQGELQSGMMLPSELLGRILASERVSKAVTRTARQIRCGEIPSFKELDAADTGSPATWQVGTGASAEWVLDFENEGDISEWVLTRKGDVFTIEFREQSREARDVNAATLAQYSLDTYAEVFRFRNCNPKQSVREMLSELKKRLAVVTEANVANVCAWVVQLGYDSEMIENGVYEGMRALGDLFQDLADAAILAWSDTAQNSEESS